MRSFLFSVLLLAALPASAQTQCQCDLDDNGYWTKLPDYNLFMAAFGSKKDEVRFNARADMDNSGTVTVADWNLFMKACPLK